MDKPTEDQFHNAALARGLDRLAEQPKSGTGETFAFSKPSDPRKFDPNELNRAPSYEIGSDPFPGGQTDPDGKAALIGQGVPQPSYPVPTMGRTVHYMLNAYDAAMINRRRRDASEKQDWHRALKSGAQVHVGNSVEAGEVYPMVIVRVWGNTPTACVNGQVLLDGCDQYWATSVSVGDKPGYFAWPART